MQILHSLLILLGEMAPYILLGFLIAGLLHAFVPQRAMARHLSGKGLGAAARAAAIGIPLPLCSCGVLPAAVALHRGGASRSATTSFLISTPQTGVDSIAATASLLGPAFAVIRPVAALVTALFGGMAVGAADKDSKAADHDHCHAVADERPAGFVARMVAALRYGFIDLVGSIGPWLVGGLVIAALINVYLPADALAALGDRPLLAMLAVLVLAVPMYVCATGSIPIAMSLMLKGLSPGAALVLLMAGPAANFASFTLISRELGRRAAIVYIASISVGAIAFGVAIDYLMPASWFDLTHGAAAHCCSVADMSPVAIVSSAVLAALLVYTFIRNRFLNKNTIQQSDMTPTFNITGMNCPHCQASVNRAIAAVEGVEKVEVSLTGKCAVVEGNPDAEAVIAAVRNAGFEASLQG